MWVVSYLALLLCYALNIFITGRHKCRDFAICSTFIAEISCLFLACIVHLALVTDLSSLHCCKESFVVLHERTSNI